MARTISLLALLFFAIPSIAQIRELPAEVQKAFTRQYPDASGIEFKDNLINVQVFFTLNNEKMKATYTNKGAWKETEKDWSFDRLPEDVKIGFQKSKYADWNVTETKVVYYPGGVERYKVRAEKSDLQKKNIFFNTSGRLVDDTITL